MSEQKADTQLIMTVSFDLIFLIQGGGVGTMQHFYAGPTREHIVISKGITWDKILRINTDGLSKYLNQAILNFQ